MSERCPKCNGKMVPYNPGKADSDSHCRIRKRTGAINKEAAHV